MTAKYQLIDTSFLYALYNRSDSHHVRTLAFAQSAGGTPLVPSVILPEVCYLFLRDAGHRSMTLFVQAFSASDVALVNVVGDDIKRSGDIAHQYRDAEFDFVDCCVMALAERLNITDICTYDRRDFSIFRPKHCHSLTLLPDD